MVRSFHSMIAQHIIELELEEVSKRNPSLGFHRDNQSRITWEMLIDGPQAEALTSANQKASQPYPLFPDELPSFLPSRSDVPKKPITDPVAIIGAGVAGLRIAMMLKHLGIPYVVFEASERYGGRVYTYYFKKQDGEPVSNQTYFDVGAMRFPDNAANVRTFELFEELGITKEGGVGGKLLPYHLSTDDNILLFNGETHYKCMSRKEQINRECRTDIKKTVAEVNENPREDHFDDGVRKGGKVGIIFSLSLAEVDKTTDP